MKYNYKKLAVLSLISIAGYFSINMSSGPAAGGERATGSSFDGQTCSACHSGGSYGTGVTLQLLHAGSPVSTYNWNGTYVLRITRTNSTTPPYWGFQVTCAGSTSPYPNNNTWGTPLPANTQKITASSRQYIEHSQKLAGSISQIDIPWIAPSSGTTTLKFNVAVISANGSGSNGDQVATTSLTVSSSGLPVTWLYFNGIEANNQVRLEWAASYEKDCLNYTVEKSNDGNEFTVLAKVNSKNNENGTSTYTLTDETPFATTYYRVKQTDFNGNESYFKTIVVKSNSNTKNCAYYYNGEVVVNLERDNAEFVNAALYAIDGSMIANFPVFLNSGMNRIAYPKPETTGIYFIKITNTSGVVYDTKIFLP